MKHKVVETEVIDEPHGMTGSFRIVRANASEFDAGTQVRVIIQVIDGKIEKKLNTLMDTYERIRDDNENYAIIKMRHDISYKMTILEYFLGMEKSNEIRNAHGWKEFDEKTWKEYVLDRIL